MQQQKVVNPHIQIHKTLFLRDEMKAMEKDRMTSTPASFWYYSTTLDKWFLQLATYISKYLNDPTIVDQKHPGDNEKLVTEYCDLEVYFNQLLFDTMDPTCTTLRTLNQKEKYFSDRTTYIRQHGQKELKLNRLSKKICMAEGIKRYQMLLTNLTTNQSSISLSELLLIQQITILCSKVVLILAPLVDEAYNPFLYKSSSNGGLSAFNPDTAFTNVPIKNPIRPDGFAGIVEFYNNLLYIVELNIITFFQLLLNTQQQQGNKGPKVQNIHHVCRDVLHTIMYIKMYLAKYNRQNDFLVCSSSSSSLLEKKKDNNNNDDHEKDKQQQERIGFAQTFMHNLSHIMLLAYYGEHEIFEQSNTFFTDYLFVPVDVKRDGKVIELEQPNLFERYFNILFTSYNRLANVRNENNNNGTDLMMNAVYASSSEKSLQTTDLTLKTAYSETTTPAAAPAPPVVIATTPGPVIVLPTPLSKQNSASSSPSANAPPSIAMPGNTPGGSLSGVPRRNRRGSFFGRAEDAATGTIAEEEQPERSRIGSLFRRRSSVSRANSSTARSSIINPFGSGGDDFGKGTYGPNGAVIPPPQHEFDYNTQINNITFVTNAYRHYMQYYYQRFAAQGDIVDKIHVVQNFLRFAKLCFDLLRLHSDFLFVQFDMMYQYNNHVGDDDNEKEEEEQQKKKNIKNIRTVLLEPIYEGLNQLYFGIMDFDPITHQLIDNGYEYKLTLSKMYKDAFGNDNNFNVRQILENIYDNENGDDDDDVTDNCGDKRVKELAQDLLILHDALLNYENSMKDKVIKQHE